MGINASGVNPDQLQKTNITIVNNSEAPYPIENGEFLGLANAKQVSSGDSGGPWAIWDSSLQKYILIGLTKASSPTTYHSLAVKTSYILDFLLPHYLVSITGGSDQVCTASTFSVRYTSCTISYGNSVNGNSDTWCTSHSGNYFSIESDYDLNSYEVRLKKYPGLQVVMTTTASKGQNTLNYMLSQGWYTMEARLLGCKNGDWVTTGEVEAVDCSSNYSFSLTPNPATNVVTLTLDDVNTPDPRVPATFTVAEGGKYEVQIWSETALMKKYTFDRPTVDIPVSDLRSGRYFVLVIVNGKKLTQQLIIR